MTERHDPTPVGEILQTPRMREAIDRWKARSPEEQQQALEEERARERAFELDRRRPEIEKKLAEIPRRFADAGYSKTRLLEWAESFIASLEGDSAGINGLILTGPTGTYKSMNMWAIFKDVVKAGHLSIEFYATENLLEELRSGGHPHEVITRISKCSLLLLDDLGTQSLTDWRETKMFQILDNRWAHKRPVIVSTNLLVSQFSRNFGARIAGRINELCPGPPIKFTGPDARFPEDDA